MPKARSLTGRTETVYRWRIRTDGRVEDFHGNIREDLPIEVAYSPQAVDMVLRGCLEIEGLLPASAVDVTVAPSPPTPSPEEVQPTPDSTSAPAPVMEFNKKRKKG